MAGAHPLVETVTQLEEPMDMRGTRVLSRHARWTTAGLGLLLTALPALAFGQDTPAAAPPPPAINGGDTAWMLISTALVLLMTPALAFFYGGLVRSKNALNTMMMSFISLGFVGVLWTIIG